MAWRRPADRTAISEKAFGRPLKGQLLFADVVGDKLTLDFVLSEAGDVGTPVTFLARMPGNARGWDRAIAVLRFLAAEGGPLQVTVTDGPGGPEVLIQAATQRIVLHP